MCISMLLPVERLGLRSMDICCMLDDNRKVRVSELVKSQ